MQRKLLQAFSVYREAVPLDAAKVIVENATEAQLFSTVRGLLAQSLMQAVGEGRYQPHPIVANYAQYHFIENNDEANRQARQAAHTKAAQYYLQQAAKTCLPRDKRQHVSDVQPLVEAVWHLCQAEQQKEAYDLMVRESLFADLRRWGGNVILLELCQLLLPGHWQPEPSQTVIIYSNIASVYNALGQKQEALKYYEQALRIFGEVGDRGGEGTTLHNIGTIYFEQDHNDASLASLLLAKRLFEELQSPNRDVTQSWIDSLHEKVGEKQFASLLAQVEPRATQIVEEALREGA